MIDNLEAKITFEIPNHLDFDRLIRGSNNYTGFWQNLQHQQDVAARAAAMGSLGVPGGMVGGVAALGAGEAVFGDYNASDFNLLSSLQNFASRSAVGPGGLGDGGGEQLLDPTYERFIGDVWVGIVLTLMILSSIFCMCSCFLYHKFRQWQRSVLTARSQTLSSMDVETPPPYDVESLPSYTIVSGLPSYNDAIEQLKQKHHQQQQQRMAGGYEPVKVHHHASVIKLFESQSQELMISGGGPKLEEIRYNFVSGRSTSAAAAIAGGGDSSPVEVLPATSSNTNTVTATTVVAVPSFKSPSFESDGTIVVGLKKFHISRYSVEDERSSSGVNS